MSYKVFILLVLLIGISESQVPTVNAYQRTYAIKYDKGQGTAFTIDWEKRQYLITAKHVMPQANSIDTIEIFHEKQWKSIEVKVLRSELEGADVLVLIPPIQLSPSFPLEPSSAGMLMGQDVFILGFPSMLRTEAGVDFNRGFPVAFVKKGAISAMWESKTKGLLWYADLYSNGGFSGGPLVFSPNGDNNFQVAGVVLGHIMERDSVEGALVGSSNTDSLLTVYGNAHITQVIDISMAMDIIRKHPEGIIVTY